MAGMPSPQRLAAAAPRFTDAQLDHLRDMFAPVVAEHFRARRVHPASRRAA